jgi:hypothetical protein
MSQISATKTLHMGISTATNNLYVLSCIGSRDRGMSDTISKDPGKEEPEQSKCSMYFSRSKGGWTKPQYSHSWRNKGRKPCSLIETHKKPMGK